MKNSDREILRKIVKYCDDGELVSRLSNEFIEEYNMIPWYAIKGMRNLHAHDYENVDFEIVWNTLVEDIPDLKEQINRMIN